jgi:hypothetical protein
MATDLLKAGSEFLRSQRKAHMATLVTYYRGATSIPVYATGGRTQAENVDTDGSITVSANSHDFLINAADLQISGVQFEPAEGDRIVDTEGGFAVTYEAMADLGEPCFRYTDRFRGVVRVHTKQTKRSAA